jgi:hypothetical protein
MTKSNLTAGFNKIVSLIGRPILITTFNYSIGTGSVYDDDVVFTGSSVLATSGIIFPLEPSSSQDGVLMEQGKLTPNDLKLYITGSITLGSIVKIGIGSPAEFTCQIMPNGTLSYEVENSKIYKKVYLKRNLGPIIG